MPQTLQQFLAAATTKAAEDLIASYHQLSEDKRHWTPEDQARNASHQVAECAVLNGHVANLIATRQWGATHPEAVIKEINYASAMEWDTLHNLLLDNARKAATAIAAVPENALDEEVQTPFGMMTLTRVIAYPQWNMTYHQGQINYIAAMLGCLK